MKTTKTTKELVIPAIDKRQITIKVVGDTPLIMNDFNEKTKLQMLENMMGKAKTKGRDAKDPVAEFIRSMYWLEGAPDELTEQAFEKAMASGKAKFGFKAVAFKAAAVAAGFRSKVTKDKVSMQAAFHINGQFGNGEFVEISGVPKMREDVVRVANGKPDIRYRGEFSQWEAELPITYNAGAISDEQVANLLNLGGFACGIGEWRVEKGGSYGMFHVE